MATHHSTTKRTKSTNAQIVVPSWDKVWSSFNAENKKTTIEAMNAEGWKTIDQVAQECGLSKSRINHLAVDGKIERTKRKVFHGGRTREVNFVRPLV